MRFTVQNSFVSIVDFEQTNIGWFICHLKKVYSLVNNLNEVRKNHGNSNKQNMTTFL